MIEVLLVVFIMGLAGALVVMTLPPRAGRLEQVETALMANIASAQDEAILTGQSIALHTDGRSYAFQVWSDGAWQASDLATSSLPDGVAITVDPTTDLPANAPEDWPDIRFDPLGETTPATIELSSSKGARRLTLTASGEVARVSR